jgi:hypothetical protein
MQMLILSIIFMKTIEEKSLILISSEKRGMSMQHH